MGDRQSKAAAGVDGPLQVNGGETQTGLLLYDPGPSQSKGSKSESSEVHKYDEIPIASVEVSPTEEAKPTKLVPKLAPEPTPDEAAPLKQPEIIVTPASTAKEPAKSNRDNLTPYGLYHTIDYSARLGAAQSLNSESTPAVSVEVMAQVEEEERLTSNSQQHLQTPKAPYQKKGYAVYGAMDAWEDDGAKSEDTSPSYMDLMDVTGSHSLATGSDWNQQFVQALELSEATEEEALLKYKVLSKLSIDFAKVASDYGRTIITELCLPVEHRTIQPRTLGGIAGGDKYLVNGILFKLARDVTKPGWGGRYLYGGKDRSDENASKAAGHDLRGAARYFSAQSSINDSSTPELFIPMQALIDYRGFRIIALPLIPIGDQPVYGSKDAALTVHTDDPAFNDIMTRLGAHLHLKGHYVNDKLVHTGVDVEGHNGKDGRRYILDLARAFPPESPRVTVHLPQCPNSVFFRLLRPEFLAQLQSMGAPPLSSDSFSNFGVHDHETHHAEVDKATALMLNEIIPRVSKTLKDTADKAQSVADRNPSALRDFRESIGTELHKHGINMRHIGLVRAHLDVSDLASQVLLVECVKRTLKNILRAWLRDQIRHDKPSEHLINLQVVAFMNLCTGSHEASEQFWNELVLPGLHERFGKCAFLFRKEQNDFKRRYAADLKQHKMPRMPHASNHHGNSMPEIPRQQSELSQSDDDDPEFPLSHGTSKKERRRLRKLRRKGHPDLLTVDGAEPALGRDLSRASANGGFSDDEVHHGRGRRGRKKAKSRRRKAKTPAVKHASRGQRRRRRRQEQEQFETQAGGLKGISPVIQHQPAPAEGVEELASTGNAFMELPEVENKVKFIAENAEREKRNAAKHNANPGAEADQVDDKKDEDVVMGYSPGKLLYAIMCHAGGFSLYRCVQYVLRMVGKRLTAKCQRDWRQSVPEFQFTVADIEDSSVRIKTMPFLFYIQGKLLNAQATNLAVSKKHKVAARVFSLAIDLFSSALEADPRNQQAQTALLLATNMKACLQDVTKAQHNHTLLMRACAKGHDNVVQSLIHAKASVSETITGNDSALATAVTFEHPACARVLLEHDADPEVAYENNGMTPLLIAVKKQNPALVSVLLEFSANTEATNTKSGYTAVLYAAEGGDTSTLKALLSANPVLNVRTAQDSFTPLDVARRRGNDSALAVLSAAFTPMEQYLQAARHGDLDTVVALLGAGVPVDCQDDKKQTALVLATQGGHFQVVNHLIEHKANPNATSARGRACIFYAVDRDHASPYLVKPFCEAKADMNVFTRSGLSPLHILARRGYKNLLSLVVNVGGADVNHRDVEGYTPLSWAAIFGHEACVTELIKLKSDVNTRNRYDWSPLLRAAWQNKFRICDILVRAKADVNSVNHRGRHALIYTALRGHRHLLKYLLANGADPDIVDDTNHPKNAYQHAMWKGFTEIAEILKPITKDTEVIEKNM